MKKVWILSLLAGCFLFAGTAVAQPADEEELQLLRVINRLEKLQDINVETLKNLRLLERENAQLKEKVGDLEARLNSLLDDVVKIQNVEIANIKANEDKIFSTLPTLDWGTQQRDCIDIETEHQQVQMVKSRDGKQTMRYLCYDGQALHMGTELNVPLGSQ